MIAWLFICNAILKYAEKYPKKILTTTDPITLNEVMDCYALTFKTSEAKFLSEYLKAYIADRKAYFAKQNEVGNYGCKEEAAADKDFVFEHDGRTSLF